MAMKDWFSRRTPLEFALERGMRDGAKLADELQKLGDYTIKSEADARAVCHALERVDAAPPKKSGTSPLHSLVALFQDVEGRNCGAFPIMAEEGNRLLAQIVDRAMIDPAAYDESDLLFALKILAMYGTRHGSEAVLRAARLPLKPDGYMWSVVLSAYTREHPYRGWLFERLSNPLPTNFLAIALLDSANAAHFEGAAEAHPFDSAAGTEQLERWLTDKDESHISYAVSATAALPFITGPRRDELISLALDHSSQDVQIEAAWVAGKLGRQAGIRWLARHCLDIGLSERAKRYLTELGAADAIPPEAEDPEFQAKAIFAQWLAHPNELGRAPDELEVIDHRQLAWPPEGDQKDQWLLRYRVKDDTGLRNDDVGVGLVGSVTFCLFSYKLEQRPPEDIYAIHCYWEMKGKKLISELHVPEDCDEYDSMLQKHTVEGISDARIITVAELSPGLKYPASLVALAKATRHGAPGWLALDGPRSQWYAASDMPESTNSNIVLMIHVGRALLGFADGMNRYKFLKPAPPKRAPEQTVSAYEKLFGKVSEAAKGGRVHDDYRLLGRVFEEYASALAILRDEPKALSICRAYEMILALVNEADPEIAEELANSHSPLGENFEHYVDALIELKREVEVASLIAKLRPQWDHNLGYGMLGSAAFKSEHDQLAESLLVQLRNSFDDWCRASEMNILAEIWCKKGRVEEANALLIDAMKGLLEESRSATGSDRSLFEEWFQDRRSAYLRLLPDRGERELERNGIPPSTFRQRSQ